MQFNKFNFFAHLVDTYVKLTKQNNFTNNKDHVQVIGKSIETQIDFGKWIQLQHFVTVGTEGMKCEGHLPQSKGCILMYLTNEIEKRKLGMNQLADIEEKIEANELSIEDAIKIGAIKAMEELKAYILLK